VHPALAVATRARPQVPEGRRVLVLGGGDGLAVREILRHPDIAHVDLVDLDPAMTELFATHAVLSGLNEGALTDARVHVHNRDALDFVVEHERAGHPPYDVVVVDLPDPNNFSLGKLYSASFYARLRTRIRADGAAVVQATSPYLAPRSFWCIVRTLESVGLAALPYHAHVPSFGDWGFVLVGHAPRPVPTQLVPDVPRKFLDNAMLPTLFVFPQDQQPPEVDINRLNDQLLVHYYEQDLADPLLRSGR
jgi:spermidine synthase